MQAEMEVANRHPNELESPAANIILSWFNSTKWAVTKKERLWFSRSTMERA